MNIYQQMASLCHLTPITVLAKFSKTTEAVYGREINIQFSGNNSAGHSCSQHANCTLPQNIWHCVWLNCTCIISFLIIHQTGVSYLVAKEQCSLKAHLCTKFQRSYLCVWNISGIFYFSSWNMGPTLYILRSYFCSAYQNREINLTCLCHTFQVPFTIRLAAMSHKQRQQCVSYK